MCNTVNSWSPLATDNSNTFLLSSFLPLGITISNQLWILDPSFLAYLTQKWCLFYREKKSYKIELTLASKLRIEKPIYLWTYLFYLPSFNTYFPMTHLFISHTANCFWEFFYFVASLCSTAIHSLIHRNQNYPFSWLY